MRLRDYGCDVGQVSWFIRRGGLRLLGHHCPKLDQTVKECDALALDEVRVANRIPKSRVWFVGERAIKPARPHTVRAA